jgi:hypothetical protein
MGTGSITLELCLALWPITVLIVVWHSVKLLNFTAPGLGSVAGPAICVVVALLAALIFPLAFVTVGAFAMDPADQLLSWLQTHSFASTPDLRRAIGFTADGLLTAFFVYLISLAVALVLFRTTDAIGSR